MYAHACVNVRKWQIQGCYDTTDECIILAFTMMIANWGIELIPLKGCNNEVFWITHTVKNGFL